jgi:hypothetical protein
MATSLFDEQMENVDEVVDHHADGLYNHQSAYVHIGS